MLKGVRSQKMCTLLVLCFTLFLILPTGNNNFTPIQNDSEFSFPLVKNMTPALGLEDYVDSNLSDIDSSPDIGTHSSFTNQQAGPDSSYDTLQEENTDPPPSDTENDIDNNTSDLDGVSDIGTEQSFSNSQGTTLDSSNMILTEANAGQIQVQDFVVITGTTTFGSGQATVTITEGTDYTLEAGQDSTTSFIRITNTMYTAMGEISSGGSQNHDTWAARIQNPDNIATSIIFERDATTSIACRVTWEIVQYVGSSGGTNEMIVRDVGVATTSGTTNYCDGSSISTISDSSDVIVFITGQFASSSGRNDIQYGLFTASLEGSGPYNPRFTRSLSVSSNDGVSYAVVEFTGTNWRPIQRLEVTTESSTAWTNSNYATAYTDVTIASEGGVDLLNYSKAFMHMQYRTSNNPTGLDDCWDNIQIIDNSNLRIRNSATSGTRWKVVWIMENTQTGQGQMQVEHLYWYDGTTSGSEERVFTKSITSVEQMNQTSLFIYVSLDGSGTAYPRGSIDYRLTAVDTITLTESDNGQERVFTGTVVQWPFTMQDTPYKANFEYQWTTADFDEANENISIYVSSHTGTENLTITYWNSGWQNLVTISATGWTNISATGLTGSTYTLRFLGSTETVDASQDVWDIDLITLHSWTLLSYSYELDLEVQWTTALYSDTNEELCINSGTLDAESIRVDAWAGSSWTNILFDLNENSWTNISVGTWLTGPTFTIRFRGDLEVGDTIQSSWQIDSALLHTWNNSVPQNVVQPSVSNIDDSTYLYAQYKKYQITTFVNDGDGYTDIDYLELTLTSNDRLTEYWTVRFDEDTDIFNEQSDPSDYILLDAINSSSSKSGNILNATFYIRINWNHPDIINTDVKCEVFDSDPASDLDYYEVDWDIETRLDTSVGPSLEDGSGTSNRGNVDSSMSASGTVTYLGSALHPLLSEIDIWISAPEYGTQTGPWEATNYEDVGGTFSTTVYADNLVGLDTFTFKAVEEGTGVGGNDLFDSSQSVDYISDRVQVQSYTSDDSRINVDDTAMMHIRLYYDYDDSFVVDGTVGVNGIPATYSGSNGIWDYNETKSSVQMVTYDTLVYSGGAHGISVEDQNGQNLNQIWDNITVVSYSVIDNRVNVNSTVNIDVTLIFTYDSTAVTVGTITINGNSATHQGGGVWRLSDSKASVQEFTYNLVVASGSSYGITLVDQNSQSQSVIWDQITVISYSVLDDRVNLDYSVNINVTLEYAYDNTAVSDGVVTINLALATYLGNGVWNISTSKSTVQDVTYNSVVCSGNTHGISDVNQNSQSILVIWDQITVRSYSVSDNRTNINDNVNTNVTIEYEYDDSPVTDGSVTINAISATHLGGGVWNISQSRSSVQDVTFNTVACSGNTHGISNVNQNGQSQLVIWDQITVRSYTVIDGRVNIDDAVNVDVLVEYEYDDTAVVDGSVTINAISATHVGAGVWRITETNSSVQNIIYNTIVCSGNDYGINDVNQNGQSTEVIWDQVVVRSYSVVDDRVDISSAVAINVTLEYEYDDTPVTVGSVTINAISATHLGGGVWNISEVRGTVQSATYNDVQCSGNLYGITSEDQNSQSQQIIWDQIAVRSYAVLDNRVNLDDSVNVNITLEYAYDNTTVVNGAVTINAISATHLGGGVWRISQSRSSVQGVIFDTVACSGNTHGISTVNQNGQSQLVIWDQITVRGYEVSDPRDNVGDTITVTVELEYEYDDAYVTDGTVTINSVSFTYTGSLGKWSTDRMQSSVMDETYSSVVVSGNAHGITDVNQNGQSQTIVWDRIQVLTTVANDTRLTIGTFSEIRVTLWLEYDSTFLGAGDSVTLNGVAMTWDAGDSRFELNRQNPTIGQWLYFVNSSLDATYGISALNLSSQDVSVIWDQITVRVYDVADNRVNLDDSVSINVTIEYEYDDSPVIDGSVTINGVSATHLSGGVWNITQFRSSVLGVTFNTVACSGNTYGISSVNQNGQSQLVIWDQITVRSYTVIDGRVNVDDAVNIDVLVEYEFDDNAVIDGSVTINAISATHLGAGIWRITETKSSVQNIVYNTIVCSGNAYSITDVDQNGQSTEVIWDQVVVRSYSVADDRVDISSVVPINVTLEYEYDDTPVTDGSVTINSLSATHLGGGVWNISQVRGTVQSVTYDDVQCSGNLQGITNEDQNSQSQQIIWDQITVRLYAVADSRVNLDNSVNINATLEYEYDDSPVTDGSVTINAISATHLGGGVWNISQSRSSVQDVTFNTVACTGNTHGISNVNQNGQSQLVIWDQITVRGYEVSDPRDNVGDTITVTVELEYEYDDADVTDGTVTINSVSFTYTGSLGKWSTDRMQSSVMSETYSSVVVSGNSFGITNVNQNGQTQTIVWDRIQVVTTVANDTRVTIGKYSEIRVTLWLEYDSTFLGVGDSVTLNGVSMTWDAGDSRFELSRQNPTIGQWLYFVNSSLEVTYGISALNLNSQEVSVIWDQITVRGYDVADNRVNLDDSVNINVTIEYEYDDSPVADGSVTINAISATHLGGGVWNISQSRSSVQGVTFDTVTSSGNTHGISSVNQNGQSQLVIWDSLIINIVADLDTVGNGIQVNFTMSVIFQFDSAECTTYTIKIARNGTHWNTFTSGNISLFVDSNSNVVYTFNTSIVGTETTYGITEFSTNTETVTWGGGINAPVNDSTPILTNPDDSDYMYAKLRYYVITSNVSDVQGYADIDYVELSLWDNARATEIWRIRYTESTNLFSVQLGSAYLVLASWSSYVKTGNDINITWEIKIDWDHVDLGNIDIRQYVIDGSAESDENWYESDWHVETRLDYSSSPSLSDDRGDLNTNDLVLTGTAVYYGSLLNPRANETDVWILHDVSGTWSSNVNGFGAFSISSITSSAVVRLNTYTVKVVVNGTGSGGTDLYYSSSFTTEFITDRIEFYTAGAQDGRINVNNTGTAWWKARYDYDNAEIISGLTSSLNGSKTLIWDSTNSRWYYSETVQVVGRVGYSVFSASESGYGLTGWTQTATNVTIIWDLIVVRSYSVIDSRVNLTDSVDIDVLLEFEFDDSFVDDGTVVINSITATYQGSGLWRISESRISVLSVTYDSVSCIGNTYNITLVNQNSQSQIVIWDQVVVNSYSVTDNHVNVDDLVNIDVTLVFGLDSSSVTTGAVTINGVSATHQGGGVWRITQTRSTAQGVSFNTVACSGNAHGITTTNQNGQTQLVIWDQVVVISYTVLDDRVNVDDNVTIDVLMNYGYDGSPVIDGTVSINSIAAANQGSGVWRIIESKSSVQAITYNNVSATGSVNGITSIDQNGQSKQVIWDQIIVSSYFVADSRVNINDVVEINVTLEYEYDASDVVDGVVFIQSVSASYITDGIWQINTSKGTIQAITYDTVVCSGNSYGISSVNQNSQQQIVIWDQITVRSYVVADSRVNVDDSVNVNVTIEYEFDDTAVTDGAVTINGISATHLGSGVWRITESKSSVQAFAYDTVASVGNLHNISSVNQNSQQQTMIWDQITVRTYDVVDSRVNVNDSVNVDVTIEYEYDDTAVTDGAVTINGISATHLGSGVWRITESKSSVQAITYNAVVCSGNSLGISSVNQNSQQQTVIWDQIIVRSYIASDSRVNINNLVVINVTLEYEYDSTDVVDGVVLIQSVSASYITNGIWQINASRSTVQAITYATVVCSGNSLGISSVNQNSQQQTVIWDQITVRSYAVADNRVNVNDSVNVDVTIEYEYDDTAVTDGTVTINGISATHIGSGVWRITESKSSVQSTTYDTVASVGNLHNISSVNQNSQQQTVIWDQITVRSYDVADNRVNVNDSVNVDVTIEYEYDDTAVTDGTVTINGISATHIGSGVWRITDSKSSVQSTTYDTVVSAGNLHSISSVNQNSQQQIVIWDQIIVRSYNVSDNRVNLNDLVEINVTLEYEYDASDVVDGLVFIQSVSASYITDGIWQINASKITVQAITYDVVVCSGNSLGISTVNQDSQQQIVIWDQITVRSYLVLDSRVNIDDSVDVDVTLEYEHDDTAVTDGTVTINGINATHVGSGVWRITESKSSVQSATYDTVVSAGNLHDINNINQNSQQQTVIWDQITVRSYLVLDSRVNVNDTINVDVTIEYEFDSTIVADGLVQVNGIIATYRGSGVWRINVSNSAVGANLYNSVVTSGNAFGITDVNQNGQSQEVIWDQVVVRSLIASDERDNVGSIITVNITLEYEYDDADVVDGSVVVNSMPFTYSGTKGIWSTNRIQSIVTSETFDSVVVSGNTYGIGSVNQSGLTLTIIWDRIRILTTSVDETRISTDSTATIMVTAELEYDGHPLGVGDSLFTDDSLMTWNVSGWFFIQPSQSTVGLWSFFVNTTGALEATHEISQINTMGLSQDVIWDRILITITPDAFLVIDFVEVNFILAVSFDYDDSPCTTYVVDVGRNGTLWSSFSSANASQFKDSNFNLNYEYAILSVALESAYGITVFTTNTASVTWYTPANFAPFNNGAPTLLNPDDSDSMYSRLRYYFVRSSVIDYDGFADLDYVELALWDNSRIIEVWRIRFTISNHSFSIELGSQYIALAAWSSYIEVGSLLNITWAINIDWDHFDLTGTDTRQYAVDSLAVSDMDWYESDWKTETRLDYDTIPILSDDRGDIDTNDLQATGTVVYYGSLLSPLANETDIWVTHDFSGTWSGDVDLFGDFTISGIGSSSLVRLNTYTFKVVIVGGGPGASDLYFTTSRIDTFITDRIRFYESGVVDPRIDINIDSDVWWTARYEYDGVEIQSGLTASLNGSKPLTWDSLNSRWHYQESRMSPILVGYSISGAIESGFGITSWVQNTSSQYVIWDSLIVTITSPIDQRIDLNTNASGISVSALYSYDSSTFDGTILLNNSVFQYGIVTKQYYIASSVSGGIHGISVISTNDITWCIWDQVEVVSIFSNTTYLDPGDLVFLQMYLRYDFDDAPLISGNFSLKFEDFYHVADGLWEGNTTRLSYQTVNFDTLTTCIANAYGITGFSMYGNSRIVFWDRLEFYESSAIDSRIGVGSTGFTQWSVKLQSAGINVTSGLTGQITGSASLTFVDGFWRSSHTNDVVGDQTFTIIVASFDGIDFFTLSTNDVTIIWDRILVLTTSASSTNPEIEKFIIISATLSYEYDGTEVTDGVVTLWDGDLESQISMTFNVSGGFWYANITKVEIGNYTFYVEAVSGNQYGITVVSLEGIQLTVEFVPTAYLQLTPMMIAGIGTGVLAIVLISSILVRRRYFVEIPYEIRQIDEILEAMEKEEKVEDIDVRPAERSIFDLLEPGMVELGLTMEEIMESIDIDDLEEIRISEPADEIEEVLEEFDLLDEIVEDVPVRIRTPDRSTGEFEEMDIEAYTDIEAAAEEALTLMLEEVRKIKETSGLKVPLTKEDWIERIPSQVKLFFFEEELQNLNVEELEELTQLSPDEVQELLQSITEFRQTDSIDPDTSSTDIQEAIQKRCEELSDEEIDQDELKVRLIQTLPSFVIEFFSETWLEKMSCEELNELTELSEAELRQVVDTLRDTQASGS